jgi:hypothetical protein
MSIRSIFRYKTLRGLISRVALLGGILLNPNHDISLPNNDDINLQKYNQDQAEQYDSSNRTSDKAKREIAGYIPSTTKIKTISDPLPQENTESTMEAAARYFSKHFFDASSNQPINTHDNSIFVNNKNVQDVAELPQSDYALDPTLDSKNLNPLIVGNNFRLTSQPTNSIAQNVGGFVSSVASSRSQSPSSFLSIQKSILTISSTTIVSGQNAVVTFSTNNNDGIQTYYSGSTVSFILNGGASTGSFSSVIDNHNGTYSATLTGFTAGTPSQLQAQIGNTILVGPSIMVVPSGLNAANSTVTVSRTSVVSGNSINVTLLAKDLNDNLITSGIIVSFSTLNGTSAGTFSNVVNNNNGTYSTTFQGIKSGTSTNIVAQVNSLNILGPAVTVSPGSFSSFNSSIQLSANSVSSGSTVNVTLTAKDSNNNLISGLTLSNIMLTGGTSTGTFSGIIDNGNGTYSSVFTGVTSGTVGLVSANVGTSSFSAQSLIVTVGAISPTNSLIQVSNNTVVSSNSVNVTFTAKDANGNLISGLTVAFSNVGGTSTGSFANVIDNHNGTYSTTFTGQVSGTATAITAKIGSAIITGSGVTVIPGTLSMSNSGLSTNAQSVAAGNSVTLSFIAKDSYNNPIATGGASLFFSTIGGTSSGTFSSVNDSNNGTYHLTFTGNQAGTATQIVATSGGIPLAGPSITVTDGPFSIVNSSIQISNSTVVSAQTINITFTAKDNYGNLLSGLTVLFSNTGGTSTGTYGNVVDNGNGTYNSSFTGIRAGTPTQIQAQVGSSSIVSGPLVTVTVGSISSTTSSIIPASYTINAGSADNIVFTARDANNNPISGLSPTLAFSGGGSSGIIGSIINNNNGTYAFTLTGNQSGTASTLSTIVTGVSISSLGITVNPGAFSLSNSNVTATTTSLASGTSMTVTFSAYDIDGNPLKAGGLAVSFNSINGTSTGVIGSVIDNGNGTYSASFTGKVAGTASQITAVVNSQYLTNNIPTVTVIKGTETTLNVESAANGAGTIINGPTLPDGQQQNMYAISRDWGGNFLANVSATWTLNNSNLAYITNATGANTTLVPNLSAGYVEVTATYSGFTGNSGNIDLIYTAESISNLALWYKAESFAPHVDGTSVGTWRDASGNASNSTQATVAKQPKFYNTVNDGKPAIRFGGAGALPINGAVIVNTNYTVIMVVARDTSSSSYNVILGGSSSSTNQDFHMGWRTDTQFTVDQWSTTTNIAVPSFTTQGKVFQMWTAVLEQSTARYVYLRNTLEATVTNYKSPLTSNANMNIGYWGGTSSYANADVSEILIYNRDLNSSELANVQNYLITKYGL